MDDITDPIEVLLAEVRATRIELRHLLVRMKREWELMDIRLEALTHSARLTRKQRERLAATFRNRARRPV